MSVLWCSASGWDIADSSCEEGNSPTSRPPPGSRTWARWSSSPAAVRQVTITEVVVSSVGFSTTRSGTPVAGSSVSAPAGASRRSPGATDWVASGVSARAGTRSRGSSRERRIGGRTGPHPAHRR